MAEAGAANIGFEGQEGLLERILSWIPADIPVMLLADRFYPSYDLFEWLHTHDWQYRLRVKGNILADPGYGDEVTTGELAQGVTERYLSKVRLFAQGVMTNLGILHEPEHPRTLDYRNGLSPDAHGRIGLCHALGNRNRPAILPP